MSDPITLATLAVSAAAAVSRANAARDQGNDAAAQAETQAQTVRQEAGRNAADLRRRNDALLARQRVRYASGGIRLSGSPLDLLADAASESELAIQDTLYRGESEASGLTVRGETARRRGKEARRQGLLSTGASLLGALR
jgi:hypothetical protein